MPRVRLVLLTAAGALKAAALGFAFLEALDWATDRRGSTPWLIWLLPLAGAGIGLVYETIGQPAAGGTPLVLREGSELDEGVPLRMAPTIFAGTIAGHLVGASVGREGAGVQLAGAATDGIASRSGATPQERSQLLCIAVAAGFGATFGLPATGSIFALTLCRRWRQPVVIALTAAAALLAHITVDLLGHDHARGPRSTSLDWSASAVLHLAVIGGLAGVIARVYVRSADTLTDRARTWLPSRWMRTAIGGTATLLVALAWTRDALGLSLPLLDAATSGGAVDWWTPIVKLLLTVIAVSTGWVGGEVVPLLVIGATAGSVVGDQLGMSTAVAARAAGVATFHAAAGTAMAGVAMAAELWGWHAVAPAGVAALAARLAAGRPDLYHTGQ